MTVFIQKGDAPLSVVQATKRGLNHVAKELSAAGAWAGDQRLFENLPQDQLSPRLLAVLASLGVTAYAEYVAQWQADNMVNGANNLFNHELAAYRKAVARLARYRLADGRAEVTEEQETGQFDAQGNPITETVVVQTVIAPLPATVTQDVLDAEGNVTGTEEVPNPAIVEDDAERDAAQAVVDGAAQAVKDFE